MICIPNFMLVAICAGFFAAGMGVILLADYWKNRP
jgi:hypothetical protein